MKIKDLRRRNLLDILAGYESLADFEDKTGISGSYISQITNGTRDMGDKFTDKLEKTLGLPEGWMSKAHSKEDTKEAAVPALALQRRRITNTKHLIELFRQMEAWAKKTKLHPLSPAQKAVLFQRAYESSESEDSPDYEKHFNNVIEISKRWSSR